MSQSQVALMNLPNEAIFPFIPPPIRFSQELRNYWILNSNYFLFSEGPEQIWQFHSYAWTKYSYLQVCGQVMQGHCFSKVPPYKWLWGHNICLIFCYQILLKFLKFLLFHFGISFCKKQLTLCITKGCSPYLYLVDQVNIRCSI